MKQFVSVFFILNLLSAYPQSVELTGAMFLSSSQMTSYLVNYKINSDNTITGYSVSDLNGTMETKARITGSYNPREKILQFVETNIISTKAALSNDQFCLLSATGDFSRVNKRTVFKGSFTSKSSNRLIVCDTGTLVLILNKDMVEYQEKVKKISVPEPKSSGLALENQETQISSDSELKPNEAPEKSAPVDIKPKTIGAGSITEYLVLSDTIHLDIFDDQKEDGDKITVLQNNIAVLTDFATTKKVQSLKYVMDKGEKEVLFTIISTDEGTSPPNTVKVYLINGKQKTLLVAPLKKNQKVRIRLYRK